MRRPIFVGLLVTAVIAVAAPARACIESWGPVPGVDPDVIAHANRAECAIEVGDYATAVAEYRALYGLLGPGERGALVLMNIAGAEERLGHDRAALESYEEAWRELPESLRRDHAGRTLRERERLLRERLSATDSHITGVSPLLGGSASIVAAVITGSIALASYSRRTVRRERRDDPRPGHHDRRLVDRRRGRRHCEPNRPAPPTCGRARDFDGKHDRPLLNRKGALS